MLEPAPQLGYYGKLPMKGDFVQSHLPRSFIEPWDRWLQDGLGHAQMELGDQWLELYLSAPIWQFALPAGVCGDAPVLGVFMASVDKVGRYFPFTAAIPLPQACQTARVLMSASSWLEQVEDVLISGLDENTTFADFDANLAELAQPDIASFDDGTSARWSASGGGDGLAIVAGAGSGIEVALSEFALMTLERDRLAPCIWWNSGAEDIEPVLLVEFAMPGADFLARLIAPNQQFAGR